MIKTRKTKIELQMQIDRLQLELSVTRQENKLLRANPGVFDGQWVARPKMKDWQTREWLEQGAHDRLLRGDFGVSDGPHRQVVQPWDDDEFPPGVEAAIIEYTYGEVGGISVHNVWPAVRLTKEN